MSSDTPSWLIEGQGIPPTLRWSFATDAALVALDMGRESGEVLAADAAGGLYRLDRRGQLLTFSRGLKGIRSLAWSDISNAGAALVGEKKVLRFNAQLEAEWSVGLPEPGLSVAVAPYGRFIAMSLSNGGNLVLGSESEQVSSFETIRPLKWLQFLASEAVLIGASDYGQVCAHQLNGQPLWNEKSFTSLGEMCAAGDGETILLAGFNLGIQAWDGSGSMRDSYVMDGTVSRVSCSFNADRIAAATMERQLYWLDSDGQLLWATEVDDDIVRVICDPLGEWLLCGFSSGQVMRLDWES